MTESLFTSQTPAVTNADNGNSITVGTYLTPAVDDVVSAIRWYPPTTPQNGAKGAVFVTGTSTKIVSDLTFPNGTAGPGWVEVAVDPPVAVTGGVQLAVAVLTPQFYTATTGGSSPWPLTNGNLSAPSNAGRFEDDDPDGSVQFPTDSFNNGCYFVDIVLGVVEPEDVTGEAALTLPALTASGSGSVTSSGSAALTLPHLTATGAGTVEASGSAALTLPALILAGAASVEASGAAALTLPALTLVGAGTIGLTADGALILPGLIGAGTATVTTVARSGSGWGSLWGVLNGQRADLVAYRERLRNPTECPIHFTQLDTNAAGQLHCTFGGHLVRRG